MRSLRFNKGSYSVNIPIELVRKKRLQEGQQLWVGMNHKGIIQILTEEEYNKKFKINEVELK